MRKQHQISKQPRNFKELNILLDKIGEKLDRNAELIGGIGNNLGDVAEEYFYTGLQHRKMLDGIRYQEVARNLRGFDETEWDIALKNGTSIALLEVKHKVHPEDVDKFATKKLPVFRKAFPQYANYNIYGGVAGMSIPNTSREKAENLGLMVLTQDGKNLKILNSKGFKPKAF